MSLEQAILENTKAIEKLISHLNRVSNKLDGILDIGALVNSANSFKISDLQKEIKSNNEDSVQIENKAEEIEKPKKTRTKKVVEENAKVEESKESKPTVTHDSVRELTQIKMAEGFDRVELKQMITALGFEKISDMDQHSLIKLNSQLENLEK